MMKIIKKYWFFLFLIFLIIILAVLKLKYSNQVSKENTVTNETNENTPTKVVELTKNEDTSETNTAIEEIDEKTEKITPTVATNRGAYVFSKPDGTKVYSNDPEADNLSDYVNMDSLEPLLPYSGEYFTAKKYSDTGYLEINVKNESNFDKAKEEVDKWLEDNNTNSKETLCVYYFN